MNKNIIIVTIFCLSFTSWWAWSLDSGPFIYRHSVPEKLTNKFTEELYPYLKGRDIKSIKFGLKKAHPSEKIPVVVSADDSKEEWLMNNANTGPVLIVTDLESNNVSIYWDVPQDMAFEQSYSLMRQSMSDILTQYDQIANVQNTYK